MSHPGKSLLMIFLPDNCLATVSGTDVPQRSAPALFKKPLAPAGHGEKDCQGCGEGGRFWARQAGVMGERALPEGSHILWASLLGHGCYQSVSAGAASRESGARDTQPRCPHSAWHQGFI